MHGAHVSDEDTKDLSKELRESGRVEDYSKARIELETHLMRPLHRQSRVEIQILLC